jgi:hypothetical protein
MINQHHWKTLEVPNMVNMDHILICEALLHLFGCSWMGISIVNLNCCLLFLRLSKQSEYCCMAKQMLFAALCMFQVPFCQV